MTKVTKTIEQWRCKTGSKWSGKGNDAILRLGKVRLNKGQKPRKFFFRSAIEKGRDICTYRDFLQDIDGKNGVERLAEREETLTKMTPLQRYLYRKCINPNFQSAVSIAAIDAMEEYNLSYYDTVYLKMAAGRKRERIFHELVRDGCLPTWYTYDAAVYFHAGVQWRQPGRPENQTKIKKINARNPPLTHVLILNNKERTFKNAITEGIVPDGFEASKIPYSNPMNFYEKNKKWLSSTGYPEPKVS